MIRRNIDVSIGLANGVVGEITSISRDPKTNEVNSINIFVKKTGIEHTITRMEFKFMVMDNVYVTRQQFPISICYTMTIHKCQGISVENALVDAGDPIFAPGQGYVAFSRVTELKGLHLISFDPTKIVADESAIREYNRLRALYRPDLKIIDIPKYEIPRKKTAMFVERRTIMY